MEAMRGRHCSFQQQAPFTMLSLLLDLLPPNISGFLRRATVLLYSLEIGYLAQSWCSSPMKKLRGRQYSFTQQTQIKPQNKGLGPLASIMNHSLTEATLQLPFSCMVPFSSKVVFLILKSLRGRHYSLIQQTQFTMLSKLLDLLPSNMKDFIRTRLPLHSLERANLLKVVVPDPWKSWEIGSMPWDSKLKSTAKQGSRPSCFKHEWFSHRSYTASSIQLYGAIVYKGDVSHSWKHWQVGSIPLHSKLRSQFKASC
jgi:hypothetical protein